MADKKLRENIHVVITVKVSEVVTYNTKDLAGAERKVSGSMTTDQMAAAIKELSRDVREQALTQLEALIERDEKEAEAKEKDN